MLRRLQFHKDSMMNDTLYISNIVVATGQHCVYYGSLLKALQLIALTHLQILRPEVTTCTTFSSRMLIGTELLVDWFFS